MFSVLLVLVIYAIVVGAGDEGFLRAADGRVLKLDRRDLPLECLHDSGMAEEIAGYEAARQMLHAVLGFVIFAPCQPWVVNDFLPGRAVRGTVILRLGPPPEDTASTLTVTSPFDAEVGASTFIYQNQATGLIHGSIIYFNPFVSDALKDRIWLHELGHAMGLAHDRSQASIMYDKVTSRSDALSAPDVKRLREAYQ